MRVWVLLLLVAVVLEHVLGDRCVTVDPQKIRKFVQELPRPHRARQYGTILYNGERIPHYVVYMQVSKNTFHPDLGPATVYTYNGTIPGPLFDFRKDEKVYVSWVNRLPQDLADHLLPVDLSLLDTSRTNIGVYAVPHLHGSHSVPEFDGLPRDYVRPGQIFGAFYDNSQNATMLWYHDHALGITRLNAHAGLAGLYLIRDHVEDSLKLPSGDKEIHMILADRALCPDGSLFYPETPDDDYMQDAKLRHKNRYSKADGAPVPSIIPEFFGNVIEANGALWPKITVDRSLYRFRILSAPNARTMILKLQDSQGREIPMTLIGMDGGFLPQPFNITSIRLMAAERADILIDFSKVSLSVSEITMINVGPDSPWGSDPDPADADTTGLVLKFILQGSPKHPDPLDWSHVPPPPDLCSTPLTKDNHFVMNLYENYDQWGRNHLQLDNLAYSDPITNYIPQNRVVFWDFINNSEDAHPIHLHQVQFKVCGRQDRETGASFSPFERESGLKDVVECPPDHITRVAAVFDLLGEYVVHCHMLEHEDFDMMRPFLVQ